MGWFMKLRLRAKLLLGFAWVVALAMLMGLFAGHQMKGIDEQSGLISEEYVPGLRDALELKAMVTAYRVQRYQHVQATSDADMGRIERQLTEQQGRIDTLRKNYEPLLHTAELKRLYEAFSTAWTQTESAHKQLLELSRANRTEEARAFLNGKVTELDTRMAEALDNLTEQHSEEVLQASELADHVYASAIQWLVVAVVVMAACGVGIGAWLASSISSGVAQARDVANAVADGRLDCAIHVSGGDEVAEMLAAMKRMQGNLSGLVGQVRASADCVATASSQIAAGNLNLSQRTEEQASALQQTAASMEELSSTVKLNADNAQQANQLAMSASTVAENGGQAVERVVTTMREITEASRKISDIIGTIDSIAFQTNILALNAAVEAARAGEQGRGFAVVASEVRTLAQRSADAAREIRALISASVEQVVQGNDLVEQAGKTMDEVVASIRRVTDIMGEISAASSEQSKGVSQVGEAVSQMDQVTQQNAALVEESAAAADSLKTQSAELVRAMSVFRV